MLGLVLGSPSCPYLLLLNSDQLSNEVYFEEKEVPNSLKHLSQTIDVVDEVGKNNKFSILQ